MISSTPAIENDNNDIIITTPLGFFGPGRIVTSYFT